MKQMATEGCAKLEFLKGILDKGWLNGLLEAQTPTQHNQAALLPWNIPLKNSGIEELQKWWDAEMSSAIALIQKNDANCLWYRIQTKTLRYRVQSNIYF